MMGLDTLAASFLEKAVEENLPWAQFLDVQSAPTGEVLTAKVLISSGEERFADVNTVKAGILRCLDPSRPSGVSEDQVATLGKMTKWANDPGKLMEIPWEVSLADVCIQVGLFAEVVY